MTVDKSSAVGTTVRSFYEDCSFPGYESFETPEDLITKSRKGLYAKALDDQLPLGVRVLDAGCGTGQLAIFLSMAYRHVVGIDFSYNSLSKGSAFKKQFGFSNVAFAQMDLFRLGLKEESFDYVFCNGVLHHTQDPYRAFQNLLALLRPKGYITVGLYNSFGRFLLELRKAIFRVTGSRLTWLDSRMRDAALGTEKKRIWFRDQYQHPKDATFTVDRVLQWFDSNNIRYVNSVPPITLAGPAQPYNDLFEGHSRGLVLDRILHQLSWVFTLSKEGGYFVMIGQKM